MLPVLGRFSPPVIRPLRTDKAEECANLHAASFAHAWSAEELATLITDPSTFGAAALDPSGGSLRGFALARFAADEAEILTIAVTAHLRGRGVGRMLLDETVRRAANAGAAAIFLEVAEDNPAALALYRRAGFAKVGERPSYYRRLHGACATAIVMRKDSGLGGA